MRTNTVDLLLDERARLVAQRCAMEGHLYAAEFLLHRIGKLMPHLIADTPHNAVARDTLLEEIRELLSEDRNHPGPSVGGAALYGEEEMPAPPTGSGGDDA